MKKGYSAGALAVLVLTLVCSPARALPIDPLSDPFAGLTFDFDVFAIFPSTETLTYDAAARRLSYSAIGDARFSFALDDPFQSAFTWDATVDSVGNVLDGGSMSWFGDFGSGNELLATGRIRDIGFFSSAFEEGVGHRYLSFRTVFDNLFLSPVVADFGPRMGLFMELQITALEAPIFSRDFHCNLARAQRDCPGNGDYFSTSGVTKIAVAEPPMFAVMAMLVGVLSLGAGIKLRPTGRKALATPSD